MPQAIPRGLTRDHVLLALGELDRGVEHPFGEPSKYLLVHEGRIYAPKASVGIACRHLLGELLPPERFSGGEAPGQANYVLRRLGFVVVAKGEPAPRDDAGAKRSWSSREVALAVADYFSMLGKELQGEAYSKAEHRSALRTELSGRSDGSVEFKHQNVSAVLVRQGLPYIQGYKPRPHYQAALESAVTAYLDANPGYLERLSAAPAVDPAEPPLVKAPDPTSVFDDPPERVSLPEPGKPWLSRRPKRVDFVARDAGNRRLGRWGEEFVVELERARLRHFGRDDLARRVDWVAESVGDGLGFDVLSFDVSDGSERLVEVKTTGLGKYHPFYVTATEMRCSEDVPERFHLYRVFDFAREPRLYTLAGSLMASCRLEPSQFRAAPAVEGE